MRIRTGTPAPARLAWALAGLTVLGGAAHSVLAVASTEPLTTETGLNSFPLITVGTVLGALVGAFIAVRHPRNPIGWLFLVGQLGNAAGLVAGSYAWLVLEDGELGPRWTGQVAGLVAFGLGAVWALTVLAIAFLLFPDGRLPSRRWRPVLAGLVLLGAAHVVAPALVVPLDEVVVSGDGPALDPTVEVVGYALELSQLALIGLALGNLVLRGRRARGVLRAQVRWLAVSAAALVASVVLLIAVQLAEPPGFPLWLAVVPLYLAYVSVPLAAGVAILRYRLYDIDVIISRGVALTVLAGFVTGGYVATVIVIGNALGRRADDRFWPSLLATALVAVAFQPVRRRVMRLANRLAYGPRAAPYEALAAFARGLQRAPATDDLLQHVAFAVREACGARRVTVVLELPERPDRGEVTATWPTYTISETAGAAAGPDPSVFDVTDRGERLGRVEVVLPPGRPLRAGDRWVVERLLAQSALALRRLRLETELAAQVSELDRRTTALQASRRAMVLARDEEKSRFAEALHRRVLPHIAALPDRLSAAAVSVRQEHAPQLDLHRERDAAGAALHELRLLVRGQPTAADQAAASSSGPNADLVT